MNKRCVFFIFVAFFLGILLGCEAFFQLFSLKSLEVSAAGPVSESFFWNNVSSASLRFWPLFFWEKEKLKKKIESEAPLSFSVDRRGIAGVDIQIEPLYPWVVGRWKENEFYITREGLAWESKHVLNKAIEGIVPPKKPLIVFAEGIPSPAEDASTLIKILPFPLDLLSGWLDGLSENKWISRVVQIDVSRREGKYLLKLSFNGRGEAQVLMWGERSRWKELSSALSQIMDQLHFLGENVIIDTTYTDRIIVRSMAHGDQEGSGR